MYRMFLLTVIAASIMAATTDPGLAADTAAAAAAAADTTAATADSPAAAGSDALSGGGLMAKLEQGGIIIVILILLSIALVAILLERLINLQKGKILPAGFTTQARQLWNQKDYKGIIELCRQQPSTIARVTQALVIHRTATPMELSTLAGDIASQDMRAHVQKLVPFALIAAIAPLLGLLGTVSGMIESFEVVAIAGSLGDASLLADGIAKALITTAVGLIVAVPAIACFNLLKSRTQKLALSLDYEANLLISEWFMEQSALDTVGDDPAVEEAKKENEEVA